MPMTSAAFRRTRFGTLDANDIRSLQRTRRGGAALSFPRLLRTRFLRRRLLKGNIRRNETIKKTSVTRLIDWPQVKRDLENFFQIILRGGGFIRFVRPRPGRREQMGIMPFKTFTDPPRVHGNDHHEERKGQKPVDCLEHFDDARRVATIQIINVENHAAERENRAFGAGELFLSLISFPLARVPAVLK